MIFRKEIIEQAEKQFLEEDKREAFLDRRYVEETLRVFELLKEDCGDFENATDRAVYDIVTDIIKVTKEK